MPLNRTSSIFAILLTLLLSDTVNAQPPSTDTRTSTSLFNGQLIESEYPSFTDKSLDRMKPLSDRTILHAGHGLWIYDLIIDLTIDNDADGHFSNFSITLDIDNSFSPRDVYAVFYLSQNQGPWFEYALTGNFTVSGNTESDSVTIQTTLETGYPNDFYNLYAEIYDAHSGALLLTYGPNQSSHVIGIPFESDYHDSFDSSVNVQLSFSGAGSLHWISVLLLALTAGFRFFNKSRDKT